MAFLVVAPHKENSDGDYSMTEFKAVSGGWTKPSEGNYKGVVDASLSARCIAGSETDENIEFYTTVKITTGKAALICNYKLDEDWNEHYVEMVLDPTGDKVTLEAVTRDDTGIETFRATLASRNMALAAATEYNCRIASKQLPDGSYAVYGYVDDFLLVEAEDLDTDLQKGMHGLENLGADTNYSEYSALFNGPYGSRDFCDETLKLVGLTTTNIGYTDLWDLVEKAIDYAESELNTTLTFVDLGGDYRLLIKDLAAVAAALKTSGGSSFSLGEFSVKTETSTETEASNIAYLQKEIARLLELLNQPTFGVA
jgi:hypothetical protein